MKICYPHDKTDDKVEMKVEACGVLSPASFPSLLLAPAAETTLPAAESRKPVTTVKQAQKLGK